MSRTRTHHALLSSTALLLSASLLLPACGDAGTDAEIPGPTDEPYEYVPPGKADDYRSTKGLEYKLTGIDSITLEGADLELEGEERDERVRELVEARFKALSFFLYAYLAQKSRSDENYGYGGFRTTIRQQTFESLYIEERDDEKGTYDFIFEAEAGGPTGLLRSIPLRDDARFDLVLPVLSNSELTAGSYSSRYKHFNPDDWDEAELTKLELEISVQENEPDAYPDYNSMFDDGLLDIAISVGGDYNDARYDISTARELFYTLSNDIGLKAPVDSFEDLRSDSGPWTGSMDANGRTIEIQVYLYHPDMQKEEGVGFDGLLQLYRDSAATRDIVYYDGHAGYNSGYSGIVVHYNPRHAIPADDFDELDLPDKYQIFVMNGCKTYTSYADAMYAHPNKTSKNLDIITTVNFSWLSEMTRTTTDFLGHLLQQESGTHAPKSYDAILRDLNAGRSWDVIYGVHGLSDNPRISPYAEIDQLCGDCSSNSDCGGVDNLCVKGTTGLAACAAACTDDSGCPSGYACRPAAQAGANVITTTQCIPTRGTCE